MKTTNDYIKQARKVHGDEYDYSKLEYKGSKLKACIICHKKDENGIEHGEFWQEANSHLKGCGCPKCKGTFLKANDDFINESKKIFGDRYVYTKLKYKNNNTKVCMICPIHGEFWQTPHNHLHGKGCPECSKLKRYSEEEYINKAKIVHNNKYDYSETKFKNAREKITVICPKHGRFEIRPSIHLHGQGCPKCSCEERKKDRNDFIDEANIVHRFKYSYDESIYVNSKTKIEIICPIHGSFFMTPNSHLQGQGCPKCGDEKMAEKSRLGKEECINRFNKLYNGKYDYTKWIDSYKNIDASIPIVCKEHGIFYKTIHSHLQGQGCPKCKSSALENSIRLFLKENKIDFEEQKMFEWLKYNDNGHLKLDFYLPKYNIAIECQGEQHYKPIDLFGGEEGFKYQVERDKAKLKNCKENGVKILYYANKKYTDEIITNKKELLKEIKNE